MSEKRIDANGTMMQYFEWYVDSSTGLWRKVSAEAGKLAQLGITALWLPPAYKDAFGIHGSGYAVYDLYDLGEFDQKGSVATKFGTKDEYLQAIADCHSAGLQVYADIVLNHKMGADETENVDAREYASNNRTLPVTGEEDIQAWTVFNFPGRGNKYSDFKWDASCFNGVDWDERHKKNAIFLFQNHYWATEVDTENGNYDYLMGADVDFANSKVVDELIRWGYWYLDMTGADGVRLDAVKHIDAEFYNKWMGKMREHKDGNLFAVGEYWSADKGVLENYLREVNGQMSLFDVPLHFNLQKISCDGVGQDLREVFANTLVAENPVDAVTFVDNHDTQPGQALASTVEEWFRPHAYALILLREAGYPCIFYGDYYGIAHNNRPPMGKTLDLLIELRAKYAYGRQTDYFDDQHCVGWTRAESGMAVILSTHGEFVKKMNVGKERAGKTYRDVLGNRTDKVVIDPDGNGQFPVGDGQASVWLDEELEI